LYYQTDEGSEFSYVARYDLTTGKKEPIEKVNWDVAFTYFSHNGKYRVSGVNEDARTKIKIYDTATGKPIALPAFLRGHNLGEHFPERAVDDVLFQRVPIAEQPLRLRLRDKKGTQAH
jgi:hypothetical protein